MIDESFIRTVVGISRVPHMVTGATYDDRLFIPEGWKDATPARPDVPPVVVSTLTGLVDYINHGIDTQGAPVEAGRFVHVESHAVVSYCSPREGEDRKFRRHFHARAEADTGHEYRWGDFHELDAFIVLLMTRFVETMPRNELIRLLGGIRESDVRDVFDDGATQEVRVAAGVTLVGNAKLPNPIELSPYRTFHEVVQPEGHFIIRLRGGGDGTRPKAALFNADGGRWRGTAINRIAEWLRLEIEDRNIKVIA